MASGKGLNFEIRFLGKSIMFKTSAEISELFDYEKSSEIWIQIGTARSPVDDFRDDQTAELKIFIEDINDNPPIFLETNVLERGISLLEDPAIGSSLYSFLVKFWSRLVEIKNLDFGQRFPIRKYSADFQHFEFNFKPIYNWYFYVHKIAVFIFYQIETV